MAGKRSTRGGRRRRAAGGGARPLTRRVETARGRKAGSTRWLARQLNDPFVDEARRRGLRSRAALKLEQIDDRFKLLRRGARVIDLGAAPGSWSQVAVARVGRAGVVVGLDSAEVEPLTGATFLVGDVFAADTAARLRTEVGAAADVVLSDLAPAAVGHGATDHLRSIALAEAAAELAEALLAPGGALVVKVLQGADEPALFARLRARFAGIRRVKPPASRAESAELYLVATGFRGAP